jgi:hypothetical protein
MRKITLITPPDFFENQTPSILFVNITEAQQDQVSLLLGKQSGEGSLSIYYYQGENNPEWLLYALNRCDAVFVNADTDSDITRWMMSYILSKTNVWYHVSDPNLKSLFSYVNQRWIPSVDKFLEVYFEQINQG